MAKTTTCERRSRACSRSHDRAAGFLEAPVAQRFPNLPIAPSLAQRRIGPYEVSALIGRGGMGEVYKAATRVSIGSWPSRRCRPTSAADPHAHQRFEREARAVAALSHPHICTLYDVGSQDGIDFLVMEYLEGETLAARLSRGPLPLDAGARLRIKIASALDRAHRARIVHRDLKPGNIMVTQVGCQAPRLWTGQAAHGVTFGHERTASDLTRPGVILGTAHTWRPSNSRGKKRTPAPICSLSARALRDADGSKGLRCAERRDARRHDHGVAATARLPTSSPDYRSSLDYVIERCLAKDPGRSLADGARPPGRGRSHPGGSERPRNAARVTRATARHSGEACRTLAPRLSSRDCRSHVPRIRPAPLGQPTWLSILPPPDGFDLAPDPAVSPDGRHVAYKAQDRSHRTHIWLKTLGAPTPLLIPGTEAPTYTSAHFWSAR